MMKTSPPDALEVVSFMAGGYRFAIEASQVGSLQSADISAAVPTAEQVLGMSGGDTSNHSGHRILLIKHPAGDYAVMVSAPVELLRLRADTIYPLPDLIAARNTLVGIRGMVLSAEGLTLLVDFRTAKQV